MAPSKTWFSGGGGFRTEIPGIGGWDGGRGVGGETEGDLTLPESIHLASPLRSRLLGR